MNSIKKPLIIGEEDDHIGYISIHLFLTVITFIGIYFWEKPIITEYKQLDPQYSFLTQRYILYLELGYLFLLSWITYSYKKLAYNYPESFKNVISNHLGIVFFLTVFSQPLAIYSCEIVSEIEIFEKSNGFIGKEIVNAERYLSFIYFSYFVIALLFLALLSFSIKVFQQSLKS